MEDKESWYPQTYSALTIDILDTMFLPIVLFLTLIASSLATTELQFRSFQRLSWLDKRQEDVITSCNGTASTDDPSPCETVCGTGSKQCVQPDLCFRPQLGETCCEDGST